MNEREVSDLIESLDEAISEAKRSPNALDRIEFYANTSAWIEDLRSANHWGEDGFQCANVSEKLRDLERHLASFCGIEVRLGHGEQQHLVWALQALTGLKTAFGMRYGNQSE